ncbi:hypothetical protein SDC9_150251 [bioreactor metagenome]|uniref:Uncharacterized protein n=1 Tax=bioreactor metagenome TaxID=1076179 RepID=A0A645ELY5_9ZZZZ
MAALMRRPSASSQSCTDRISGSITFNPRCPRSTIRCFKDALIRTLSARIAQRPCQSMPTRPINYKALTRTHRIPTSCASAAHWSACPAPENPPWDASSRAVLACLSSIWTSAWKKCWAPPSANISRSKARKPSACARPSCWPS